MSIAERCETETVELHQFFEDWYHGRRDRTDGGMARLQRVLADGFELVDPDGVIRSREDTLSGIESRYGAYAETDPEFAIEIRDPTTVMIDAPYALYRYEEHQRIDGEWTGRLSTVLFRTGPDAPNGLVWTHVHETWLPE